MKQRVKNQSLLEKKTHRRPLTFYEQQYLDTDEPYDEQDHLEHPAISTNENQKGDHKLCHQKTSTTEF